MVDKQKNLTDQMRRTEIPPTNQSNRPCFQHLVVHSFPNAIMHVHT